MKKKACSLVRRKPILKKKIDRKSINNDLDENIILHELVGYYFFRQSMAPLSL
jgi:hypothetical protein